MIFMTAARVAAQGDGTTTVPHGNPLPIALFA